MAPLCTKNSNNHLMAMASSARSDASIVAIAQLLQQQKPSPNSHPTSFFSESTALSDLLPSSPPSFLPPSPHLPLDLPLDDENAGGLSMDEVAQLVLRKEHRTSAASATVSQWRSTSSDDWPSLRQSSLLSVDDDGQMLLEAIGGYQTSMDYQPQADAVGPSPSSLPDFSGVHGISGNFVMQMMRSHDSDDFDMLLFKPASRSGSGISSFIESLIKMEEEAEIDVDDISAFAGDGGGDSDGANKSLLPADGSISSVSEEGTSIRYGERSAGIFVDDEDDGGGAASDLTLRTDEIHPENNCYDSQAMMQMMVPHRQHHIDLGHPVIVDDKLPQLVPYNTKAAGLPPPGMEKMNAAAAQPLLPSMSMSLHAASCSLRVPDPASATNRVAVAEASVQGSIIAAGGGTSTNCGQQMTTPAAVVPPPQQQQVSPHGVQLMQMLLECAKNVECRNKEQALALLPKLRFQSSRHGDPIQRLTAFFTEALWCRVARLTGGGAADSAPPSLASLDSMTSPYDLSVAFAALNDACPYFTFAHLTANQPIIEHLSAALHRQRRRRNVLLHIIDFGISHGAQWAALLQAIAVERIRHGQHSHSTSTAASSSDYEDPLHHRGGGGRARNSTSAAPPVQPTVRVRITGVASPELGSGWRESLEATGRRLEEFGASMGVEVEFAAAPLALGDEALTADMLRKAGGKQRNASRRRSNSAKENEEEQEHEEEEAEEIVVANFMLQLSNVLENGGVGRTLAVAAEMRPEVATLAEFDADLNGATWERRFVASLHFFSAMFDSLEASMARDSPHRLCMERSMLGERIVSMVGGAEEGPRRRLQCYAEWNKEMAEAGFRAEPLSGYAANQARLLLLRFPYCRSFTLTEHLGALSLGWLHKPLLSISSWTLFSSSFT